MIRKSDLLPDGVQTTGSERGGHGVGFTTVQKRGGCFNQGDRARPVTNDRWGGGGGKRTLADD